MLASLRRVRFGYSPFLFVIGLIDVVSPTVVRSLTNPPQSFYLGGFTLRTHPSCQFEEKIDRNILLESKVNFVYSNLTSIIPDYRVGVDSDELFRPAPGVNVILKHSVDAEKFTCNLLTCSYLYLDFNNFFYVSAFQQSQHTFVFLIHSFSL